MTDLLCLLLSAAVIFSVWYGRLKVQKQQLALQQTEEQLQAIVDNSPTMVYLKDIKGQYLLVNRQFEIRFNISKDEIIGKTDYDIFPQEVADKVTANDQAVLNSENSLEFEEVAPQKDGLHTYISIKFPLYNSAKVAYAVCGISTDITKRKQAEAALQQAHHDLEIHVKERTAELAKANQELQEKILEHQQAQETLLISDAILKQMPDAILITDLKGNIQKWLGKAGEIFGYTAEEVLGKPINFLHRPNIKDLTKDRIIQEIQETGTFMGEIPCIRKDGSEVPIETTAKAVYDNAGKPLLLVGIHRDITERKQRELERTQLGREQAVRAVAETAEKSSAFLAEVSAVLASSLDYKTTLESVAQLAVPYFADWCSIDIFDEQTQSIRRLAVAHIESSKVDLAWELNRRYPDDPNAARGIPKVLRSRKSEILPEILDSSLIAVARDAEHLQLLRELGLNSCIIAPLVARGRSLGVISFVTAESNRRYDTADLSLAEELARRAALAVDNARLYQEAQEARRTAEIAAERTARLQQVTAALSDSLTPSQVADVIVNEGMTALGADSTLVALLTESGTQLKIVQAVGYKPEIVEAWRYFSVDAPFPLAEAVRTGEAAWSECKAQRIERYPHLAEVYAQYDYESWISIPLIVGGKALGGITFSFMEAQEISELDRAFILAVVQQCAQAIARSHLYNAEQAARAEAEAASRMKDEFLAVLSHELRTPMNAILGWSRLLQSRKFDETTKARALETIERNAKLQSQLIEDILDVSRIIRGKLRLNINPIDLVSVIESAIDAVRPAAYAKAIQIESFLSPSIGLVPADADRLQQVIWNLLSNAIKFTPQGGQVTVQVDSTDTHVQIQVSDTGKGIHAEFLPYVFDRFRQADSTTTRAHGGLGLGLAIVRQLVELHGGTVHVKSAGEGQGATFMVQLPRQKESQKIAGVPQASFSEPESQTVAENYITVLPLPLQGLQVMIVDDETDARDFLTVALGQYGAKTTAIASAQEALEMLKEWKPDVLISDIAMPGEDGYALIRIIRSLAVEQGGQIPAIALTAYAREEDRMRSLCAGFQMHLSKPVEPAELAKAVATLAESVVPA